MISYIGIKYLHLISMCLIKKSGKCTCEKGSQFILFISMEKSKQNFEKNFRCLKIMIVIIHPDLICNRTVQFNSVTKNKIKNFIQKIILVQPGFIFFSGLILYDEG